MVTPSHVHTFLVFWNSPADRAMIPHMSLGEGRGGAGGVADEKGCKMHEGEGRGKRVGRRIDSE